MMQEKYLLLLLLLPSRGPKSLKLPYYSRMNLNTTIILLCLGSRQAQQKDERKRKGYLNLDERGRTDT